MDVQMFLKSQTQLSFQQTHAAVVVDLLESFIFKVNHWWAVICIIKDSALIRPLILGLNWIASPQSLIDICMPHFIMTSNERIIHWRCPRAKSICEVQGHCLHHGSPGSVRAEKCHWQRRTSSFNHWNIHSPVRFSILVSQIVQTVPDYWFPRNWIINRSECQGPRSTNQRGKSSLRKNAWLTMVSICTCTAYHGGLSDLKTISYSTKWPMVH